MNTTPQGMGGGRTFFHFLFLMFLQPQEKKDDTSTMPQNQNDACYITLFDSRRHNSVNTRRAAAQDFLVASN
jgi:hypothetical protein